MKRDTLWIIIVFVLLILVGISYTDRSEQISIRQHLNEKTKRIKQERDSLEQYIKQMQDSISVAYHSLHAARRDRMRAEQHTKEIIKRYEKIKFVPFVNDTQRDSVWAALYPTLAGVR